MDIHWLQTFIVAAEEENFHRTADRLHLAQPTVTSHIQKLEDEWHVTLFTRIGRHVALSPAGQKFKKLALEILETYQTSHQVMARWQQGYERTLSVAVSPLIATTRLSSWIHAFAQQYPTVEIAIQVLESKDIPTSLLDQTCDIGLSRLEVRHVHLQCNHLYSEPVILVAPPDPLYATQTFHELSQQFVVFTYNHPEYWDSLLLTLRSQYPTMRTMRISQVHVSIHFIQEGMGMSFLPLSTVESAITQHRVTPLVLEHPDHVEANSYLIIPQNASEPAALFQEFIRHYTRQITDEHTR